MAEPLTKDRLDKIRHYIRNKNYVYYDKSYLDSLYLPSQIIGRDDKAEEILYKIESFREGS